MSAITDAIRAEAERKGDWYGGTVDAICAFLDSQMEEGLPSEERVRADVAESIRDWIHEQPWSLCNAGADTCPDWDKAYELRDLVLDGPRVSEDMIHHDAGAALRLMQTRNKPDVIVIEIDGQFYWALRQWNNKYKMDPEPHPEFNVRGFPFNRWSDLPAPGTATKSYVLECKCGEKHPISVNAPASRPDFADWAEPFCSGWNQCRRYGPDVSPDDFQKILMEAYRASGPQRARMVALVEDAAELERGTKPYHWGGGKKS